MRNFYSMSKDINYINELSHKNEPERGLKITVNTRTYPSMFMCYDEMSYKLGVKYMDRIILGNGFENVMKSVLLALKPKTIGYSKPCWGMLDVYCEALDITPITNDFIYKDNQVVQQPIEQEVDVYYTTLNSNNLFTHTNIDLNNIKSKYNIIDVSYLSFEEIKLAIKQYSKCSKNIIIGSYDKLLGCGVRLGFAVFDKHLIYKIHLQREQYINAIAEDVCLSYYEYNVTHKYYDKLKHLSLPLGTMLTHNYITLPFKIKHCDGKVFNLNGYDFTRFGIPYNRNTYRQLLRIINDI